MADPGKPSEEEIGALYRALPSEEPPSAIDAAVLAAARQSVAPPARRSWAVPVSLAAVLVLSVGVTLRVAEERPDAESIKSSAPPTAPPPAAVRAPSPTPAAPEATAPSRTEPLQRERRQKAEATGMAEDRAAAQREPAFVPSPPAAPPASVQAAPQAAPPAAAPSALSERSAARADRSPSAAKNATADSSVGSIAAQAPEQTPEAWLERISTLRKEGRHADADESYVEFRRRYPAYVISPDMLQRIAPSR